MDLFNILKIIYSIHSIYLLFIIYVGLKSMKLCDNEFYKLVGYKHLTSVN